MFTPHYLFYLGIIAAGFIVGLFRYKSSEAIHPVIFLLGLTLCSEIISNLLAHTIKNNCCVYHFFNPIQTIVWGYFFYANTNGIMKKTIISLMLISLVYSIVNTLAWQDIMTFPGNYIKFECLLLLFWSFNLFIEFLDRPTKENVFNNSVYIICIAVIWFNLISYLFFELFNSYVERKIPTDSIRMVHYVSNYIYYGLLLFAMLIKNTPDLYEQK